MNKIIKAFLFFAWSFILISCNPTKQATKDLSNTGNLLDSVNSLKKKVLDDEAAKKAKIIADYLEQNPCIFPTEYLDSLCNEYCHRTQDNGTAEEYMQPDPATPSKPKTIFLPDTRQVNLLRDSLKAVKDRLLACEANAAGKKEAIAEVLPAVIKNPGKWDYNNWTLICLGLAIASGILIFLLTKKRKLNDITRTVSGGG